MPTIYIKITFLKSLTYTMPSHEFQTVFEPKVNQNLNSDRINLIKVQILVTSLVLFDGGLHTVG